MTEEEKPPIRVKMKVGNVEFEIEGNADQVQTTIENILSTITKKEYAKEVRPARAETCKGLIQSLWGEGWFASHRGLGEVHSELARKGYHYDRTAVAHALIDLVKDGLLTREGRPRRYRYAQKRPPPTL
jgi:predicted transcriptional regulator